MTVLKELLKLNEAVREPKLYDCDDDDLEFIENSRDAELIDTQIEDGASTLEVYFDGVWTYVVPTGEAQNAEPWKYKGKQTGPNIKSWYKKALEESLESSAKPLSEAVGKSAKEKLKKVLDTLLSSFTSDELDEILVDSGYGPSTRATIEKSKFVKLSPNKVAMYAVTFKNDGSFNNDKERQGKIYVELKNGKLTGEF